MQPEPFSRLVRIDTPLINRHRLFHLFMHIRFYFVQKRLIQRDIAVHRVEKARTRRKMQHHMADLIVASHMIHRFYQQKRKTPLIRFMSDLILRCHKFQFTFFFQLFVQLPQPSVHFHKDNRRVHCFFKILCNLIIRAIFRIFVSFSINCYLNQL